MGYATCFGCHGMPPLLEKAIKRQFSTKVKKRYSSLAAPTPANYTITSITFLVRMYNKDRMLGMEEWRNGNCSNRPEFGELKRRERIIMTSFPQHRPVTLARRGIVAAPHYLAA